MDMRSKKVSVIIVFVSVLVAIFALSACGSGGNGAGNTQVGDGNGETGDGNGETGDGNGETGDTKSEPNVYAGGRCDNGSNYVAGYWVNGDWVALSDGTSDAIVNSIAVDGSTVYAAGDYEGALYRLGGYWENETFNEIAPLNTYSGSPPDRYNVYAKSIILHQGDLYVAGKGDTYEVADVGKGDRRFYPLKAAYWKNGAVMELENGERISDTHLTSPIYIHYNSYREKEMIYTAGYYTNRTTDSKFPCLWENVDEFSGGGVSPHDLEGDPGSSAIPKSIAVSQDAGSTEYNVYISGGTLAGGTTYNAGYWIYHRNWTSSWISLVDDNNGSFANSIVLDGSDIYIGGYWKNDESKEVAGYWFNGVWTPLSDGTTDARVYSMVLDGSTVYAGGFLTDGSENKIAGYWKNGTWVELVNGNGVYDAEVCSIVVTH
jgi:hypothetical protein